MVRYVIDQKILPGQRKGGEIDLGSRGRGKARAALDHAILSSAAEKVGRNSPCLVLTVRLREHEFVHPWTVGFQSSIGSIMGYV